MKVIYNPDFDKKKLMQLVNDHLNKTNKTKRPKIFIAGCLWCAAWYTMSILTVGEMTNGPYLITIWDAVFIPFGTTVIPFVLGFMSKK